MVERPVYSRCTALRDGRRQACSRAPRWKISLNVHDPKRSGQALVRAPGSARGDMSRTVGLAEKLGGFWYTRAQCLQNETTLFDHLLRNKVRSGNVGS